MNGIGVIASIEGKMNGICIDKYCDQFDQIVIYPSCFSWWRIRGPVKSKAIAVENLKKLEEDTLNIRWLENDGALHQLEFAISKCIHIDDAKIIFRLSERQLGQ